MTQFAEVIRPRHLLRAAGCLLIAVGAAACHSGGSSRAPSPLPALAGSWVFSATDSDNPGGPTANGDDGGSTPGEGGERGGRGGGGMRGGGGRGMGGGRGRGSVGRGGDAAKMRALMQIVTQGRRALRVQQTDSTVRVGYAAIMTVDLNTNGREEKQAFETLGEMKAKAYWKEGHLVVERDFDGFKIVDEFDRLIDSARLLVMTTVSGLPRELKFRTVYDHA
jgi:hypothetical protein